MISPPDHPTIMPRTCDDRLRWRLGAPHTDEGGASQLRHTAVHPELVAHRRGQLSARVGR